jgi:hypothetical protein
VDDEADHRYAYVGGQYQILVKNPGDGWYAHPGARATNFTVAVSAHRVSGSSGAYAIHFGISPGWSQFYEFDIGASGYYSIWKYDSGWTALQDWTYSSFIATGTGWNRMKIIRDGASIAAYVNNHYLTTVTDSSFTGFRPIGVAAYSPDNSSLDVRFDDYTLYPTGCGVSAAGAGFEMGMPATHQGHVPPGLH